MTPPARATIWVESRGFPEIALPLHPPVTAISFILSCLGGMGVALPGMPSRPGCQRRKGRRVWQGQPSPLGPASSESPPPAQGGTESRQVRGLRRPGQSRGSRCAGMASCQHCSCRRPRLPLPTARPAGGPPFSGDPHCPPAGHFANCLAIIVHGPKSVTSCQRPGCPRWAGVGWGGVLSRKHPLPGCEVSQAPPPARPHTSELVPVLRLGRGRLWAQGDTNALGHISGS